MKDRNVLKCVKCGREIATNANANERRCYICGAEVIFVRKKWEEKNESLQKV